jgi:hypothetical protein
MSEHLSGRRAHRPTGTMATATRRTVRIRTLALGAGALLMGFVSACGPPSGKPPIAPPATVPPKPPVAPLAVWSMDERVGPVMHDAVAPFQNGRMGSGVVPEAGVFEFPGWVANVDANGVLFGTVSDTAGQVSVPDRTHVLEPRNGAFSVTGTIRSRLTAAGQLPSGAPGTSFNVVQKARANNQGGFWKVEIGASGPHRGELICTLGDGLQVVAVASPVLVGDGAWHTFSCWLGRGAFVAQVDGYAQAVPASQISTVDPVDRFSGQVAVGKKPGSTDPGDAFSGWIGEIRVDAG